MSLKAVIFDLDGVIVTTDECHYKAWKRMADELGIYFDKDINKRLRGVSRMESLEIVLEMADKTYNEEEKKNMAERKNGYYREFIKDLTPVDILPGVIKILNDLKVRGIKVAIGSSSKNCPTILEHIGLADYFDAVVDGNHIKKSKPDPEVFLLAAQSMDVVPEECLVVEDAEAGIESALSGGMKVLGVGSASNSCKATMTALNLMTVTVEGLLEKFY